MGLPHPDCAAMEVSIAGNQLETLHYRSFAVASFRAADPSPPVAQDGPSPAYTPEPGPAAAPVPTQAAWSRAVRALRETTLAEVEAQRARFVAMTGREWQVVAVEFDAPSVLAEEADAGLRIALTARVVLRSLTPTLH
jgi:hypothetical protein